jgi:2-dehydropantoate 2-reductase
MTAAAGPTGGTYHVAIMGAGAMGGIVGAALMDGGAEVSFVDTSQAVLAAVRQDGLRIKRGENERVVSVAATDDPSSIGEVDAVLFFVKCYHTAAAAELAGPLVGPATTIVSLQNGWGNGDVLQEAFPAQPLVVGITYHSGTVQAPGQIHHTNLTDAPVYLGPYLGDDLSAAERFAACLRAGGLSPTVTPEIRTEIWKKLVLNSATLPTSALTRHTAGALGSDPDTRGLVTALATETVATAQAAGYDIDIDERLSSIFSILEGAGHGKASMLQDIEAGRRTEIGVVNAAVVKAAAEHGVEAPLNQAMVALVRGYERATAIA